MVKSPAFQRVNFSLHLSPDTSRADMVAAKTLQQWHSNIKQQNDNVPDMSMEIRQFHRDIYLAGLRLYLVDPQICHHAAELMAKSDLNPQDLVAELFEQKIAATSTEQNASSQQSNDQLNGELNKLQHEFSSVRSLIEEQMRLLRTLSIPWTGVAKEEGRAESRSTLSENLDDLAVNKEKVEQIKKKGIF